MAKLYIANTSKQHHQFCYRLGEEKNYRTEEIPVGHQVLIGGGRLSHEQIAYILAQHEDKNLRDSTQISKIHEYVGLCYRLERPVDNDRVMLMFEQNDKYLNEGAADRREAVSAAVANRLEQRSHQIGAPLNRTEVEVREDTKGATSRIDEGFEVVREGVQRRHTGSRRNRKSRASL
jgi:hypothetical protein